MRRILAVLVPALVAGIAVLGVSHLTAITGQRRSIALLVSAVLLSLAAAAIVRRRLGSGAAVAVWLGLVPLGEAIRRVMGRHVEAYTGMRDTGVWRSETTLARGALEWRLDTPIVHGMWRSPTFVAFAWGVVAALVAAAVTTLLRSRWSGRATRGLLRFAWVATLAGASLAVAAIAREAGRTDPVTWARALPTVPLPTQLANLPACGSTSEESEVTLHGSTFDVEFRPLGCLVRFSRNGAASGLHPTNGLMKLTLHHDPVLDVDVAVDVGQVSVFSALGERAKVPPVSTIPLAHRISAAATSLIALALLAWPRRAARRFERDGGPYRTATVDEAGSDEQRAVRAAMALAIVALGAAPLLSLFTSGLG